MTKLTNAEFKALPRDMVHGEIIDLYGVFHRLTTAQTWKLSGDEQSRSAEYREETRVLRAQAQQEFAA